MDLHSGNGKSWNRFAKLASFHPFLPSDCTRAIGTLAVLIIDDSNRVISEFDEAFARFLGAERSYETRSFFVGESSKLAVVEGLSHRSKKLVEGGGESIPFWIVLFRPITVFSRRMDVRAGTLAARIK